jgi:uncharacterized protein YodC (DUF2158 family)
MDDTIKLGDVVQLKSSGPPMTVRRVDGSDVYCVWFIGNKMETGVFQMETLSKLKRGQGS